MSRNVTVLLKAFILAALAGALEARADIAERPEVGGFINAVADRNHFDPAELTKLFRQVETQPKILAAMDKPAEAKPWWEYRKQMVSEDHISGGVEFWKRNRASLEEAAERSGVAPEMIVAILGMETRYGRIPGNYRVIDALSTLAFEYPRRAEYFRKELEEFLLLCREEKIDPMHPIGSHAGAMGMPQFMPSSFRQYAVDLDGDHKRNIWSNPADSIASVANYFAHAGWRKGEPDAVPAKVSGEGFHLALDRATNVDYSIAQLRGMGVEAATPLPNALRAKLMALTLESGQEYWLALPNFYVITRYNHSVSYAMAVLQLGKEILARRAGG